MPPAAPALATEFELRVKQLQLTLDMYPSSLELRTWCQQNRNRIYIPEWLLKEWGITVDMGFNDAAEPGDEKGEPCDTPRGSGAADGAQ